MRTGQRPNTDITGGYEHEDRDDIGTREEYVLQAETFGHFAEACRLTAANERALGRAWWLRSRSPAGPSIQPA